MREKQYKIITKLGPNICHINNVNCLDHLGGGNFFTS